MRQSLEDPVGLEEAIATAIGEDGIAYAVIPMVWTPDKIREVWEHFNQFKIFSDDVDMSQQAFVRGLLDGRAIWFEILDTDSAISVGSICLNEMVKSQIENRFVSANFHATAWDAKAAPRRPIAKAAVKALFEVFKLHRMEAKIPLKNAGAIRFMKKIGFVEEGVMRSARRYNGEWFNALLLSIIEDEVATWTL